MSVLALRARAPSEERARRLVEAFCAALIAADRGRIERILAFDATWMGKLRAWVRIDGFENIRQVPRVLLAEHDGFMFLVDITRKERVVTACIAVDAPGEKIARVFDPQSLVEMIKAHC